GGDGGGAARLRQGAGRRVQVPAARLVRRRAPEGADRQDPQARDQGAGEGVVLDLAESVAREAGGLLRERFVSADRGRVSAKSTPTDLVSESDVAAERLIRSRLLAARPDDAIVGEEGDDHAGTSGRRWVVDPLDGTVNFLFGIPQWAVSVAVEDDAGALAGVVYDPM